MIRLQFKDSTKVKMMIAKKGNSLREFAKVIGISHPYLSQILNGNRNPSPTIAAKVAKGLEVEIEDIFLITNVAKDNLKKLAVRR